MWNNFRTDDPATMSAGVVSIPGGQNDSIGAYLAKPDGASSLPGVVLIHHAPGWDEFYREFTRRFAAHGFVAICPNLYHRAGHGTPDDVAAKVRAEGGVSDEAQVADLAAAAKWLREQSGVSNGKVGIIGSCSGGRLAVLTASKTTGWDAVVDLWGGGVVQPAEQLNPKQPVAPVDLTKDLSGPLLGLFGNDDQRPSPADVNVHEDALKQFGKSYVFHRYDGAGHGFFYYDRPLFRQQQALDGWNKVEEFFNQYLRSA
ncbi:MAG: dienelactone hydrolase family protein [Chloroflexota bacterium]